MRHVGGNRGKFECNVCGVIDYAIKFGIDGELTLADRHILLLTRAYRNVAIMAFVGEVDGIGRHFFDGDMVADRLAVFGEAVL